MKSRMPYSFTQSKAFWAEAQTLIAGGGQATRTPYFPEYPVYFEKCRGCRMWDIDGNEFIDFLCSLGPVILGYAYERVDDAARAMIQSSFQSSMNHKIQLDLAKLLIETIPSAERVRYLKTGTDATVAAVRLARHLTKRRYIARHGYHGWADIWLEGARSNGTDPAACEGIITFDGTAENLEELIREKKVDFAAVIIDPAETKPFSKENFQGIIDTAHRHGALVIFDEVKTGFRTALGGVQALFGVLPDLTAISKGMANGYPIAAVVGLSQYMDQMKDVFVSGTFSVESMSMAASLATIRELKEKNVPDHLNRMGQRFIDGLNEICSVRGIEGPLAYADPVPSMPRFKWDPFKEDHSNPVHIYFFSQCIRYGLFFSHWHVSFINYSHKGKDIDEALDICDFIMAKTKREFDL